MPLDTPPQLSTARSAGTQSMTVLDRMEAHSPGAKPRLIRPAAISRTASPVCVQFWLRQMPSFFCRIQTWLPRRSTAFQNIAGMVSPGITMSVAGWIWLRSQRLDIGPHACRFAYYARPCRPRLARRFASVACPILLKQDWSRRLQPLGGWPCLGRPGAAAFFRKNQMKLLIKNGRVIDPASHLDEVGDVAIAAGRIVSLKGAAADFAPNK